MSIIAKITNRFFTNTSIDVCANKSAGRGTLMTFLSELEHRTFLLEDCKNAREFDLMAASIKNQLKMAVDQWDVFSESYECIIGFNTCIQTSNVFSIKLIEKNGCPRSWDFRFNNLVRP